MKRVITGCAMAMALGAVVAAQDSTVKSKTEVKADDARTVTIVGCLMPSGAGGFTIDGTTTAVGKNIKSESTVKTDRDDEDTKVTSTTTTKIDNDKKPRGTSGSFTSYDVSARAGVDLAAHAGHQVEIAAVMVDPATRGDDDAKIKIEETTKVDREHGKDSKEKSTTKTEIARGPNAKLVAVSVRQVGETCAR